MSVSDDRGSIAAERQRSERLVQMTLAMLALASLVFGLGVYALASRIGLPIDSARVIASAFLLAAIADAAALFLWGRLFRPRA